MIYTVRAVFAAALLGGAASGQAPVPAPANPVTFDRILRAQSEPQNWLTYNGSLQSTHHSSLDQIKPSNVAGLDLKWVYQVQSLEKFEATPLVVDGVVRHRATEHCLGDRHSHRPPFLDLPASMPETTFVCCGNVNRASQFLVTLFPQLIDAHLIASTPPPDESGTGGGRIPTVTRCCTRRKDK
jgi:hypothetical protein